MDERWFEFLKYICQTFGSDVVVFLLSEHFK